MLAYAAATPLREHQQPSRRKENGAAASAPASIELAMADGGPSSSRQKPHPSSRHNVHVLFLSSDSPQDHLVNRLTSMIGARVHRNKGFCHTEICVPDLDASGSSPSNPSYLSSSIYNGETVTLTRTKTFANPGYSVVSFTVSGSELVRITDYLHEAKRMQLKFDSIGMYLAALPFQVNLFARDSTTFCSKHVTLALKNAGIEAVSGLNENIVTPSKLYNVLKQRLDSNRLVAGTIGYKENQLLTKGAIFTIQ